MSLDHSTQFNLLASIIFSRNGPRTSAPWSFAAMAHIGVAERGTFYALQKAGAVFSFGAGASVRVLWLIAGSRVMDMMPTGRTNGAEEGAAIGLSYYLAELGEARAMAGVGEARHRK
jgi:enoyl-CoA hydratase/carnithine racemase